MLKGKSIVITGANRGIGLEAVKACAKNGANVFACVRTRGGLADEAFADLSQSHGVRVVAVGLDLSDEDSIKRCASDILGHKTPIDGIVNNAGESGARSLFLMTSMQDIRRTFEVNFWGPMQLTQRLLKNMIRNKSGAVVNVSSAAALDGGPAQFGYVASKAAMIGATKKLAIELGHYGIRVNAVAPGVTETDMLSRMEGEILMENVNKTALKRKARPEEIADAIVYLLSGQSSYLTGQVVRVDGGLH